MRDKNALKRLAISIVLLMVVSCLTPSIAVDDNLSEVKRHSENASPLSNTIHIPDNYTKIQQTADNASPGDSIIGVNETNIEDVEVNKSFVAIKSENLTEASSSYPFFDDMESGSGNWTFEAPWDLTEEYAHSGSYSWTDSPNEFHQNNVEISLNMSIDLRFATMPVLSFWHKYSLESNRDYGYVDVSDDSGQTWTTLYFVTGDQSDWVEEKIDLTEYTWKEDVRIRFRLKTDGQNRYDGWYIDDVKIAETTASISYPFYDDMEDENVTESNWHTSSWDVLWGSNAHSGVNCLTDSPEGDMPGNVNYQSSLTIAGTVDLSTAVNPQMTFWHHYQFYSYYSPHIYGYVEVSDNYGQSGTYKIHKSYSSTQNDWMQEQIDLSEYVGLSNVRIRFRVYNQGRGGNYGWYIDDVRIDNAPQDVVVSNPTNVTMHGADLSWTKNTETDFAKYEIYRATSSDVNRFYPNTLIAVIEDQDITSYKDIYSILEPDYYHYRVYVVDDQGMYSVGSNVVQATYPVPPKVSYPFFDDMESGDGNWGWGTPWSLTTKFNHSGSHSWTDSPGTSYENNVNTALEMRIDLRDATMPMLSFWHRYSLEPNKDYGYVDVSDNSGQTWTTLYFMTGHQTDWVEEKIDLTEYALKEDVRVRFRLKTDGQTRYDGWYIDDVRIAEASASISYPFFDDMEDVATTETNWFTSSWETIWTPQAHSGTKCLTDSPEGDMPGNVNYQSSLTIAGTVDLSTAVNPQMTFWHHYQFYSYYSPHIYGYVEVSDNYGQSGTYKIHKSYSSTQNDWMQEQIDLSEYVGLSNVRIRFRVYNQGRGGNYGWYIDDVRIAEKGENEAPIASFTYSPGNPLVDEEMTFDASSSYDPDGEIESYDWDFDDGNTGTEKVTSHSYSSGGDYTVTLTVTDDYGATNSTSKVVNVEGEGKLPPTANADGPYSGNINEPIQFHGSATGGTPPYTYAWDFDYNGVVDSVLQNPTHSWSVAGTYYPTLKVVDDNGTWSKLNWCEVNVYDLIPRLGPYPLSFCDKHFIRVFNIDDIGKAYVNGELVTEVDFGKDSKPIDITDDLYHGDNEIRLTVENRQEGYTYGFELIHYDSTIGTSETLWNDSCGIAGVESCNDSQQTGIVYDKKIILELEEREFEDFSFVQVTDVHIGWDARSEFDQHKDSNDLAKEYQESYERFTATLDNISNLDPAPAFILVTGDHVEYNLETFFNGFKLAIYSFTRYNNIPFYFIPGNHDRRELNPLFDDNLVNYHKYIKTPGPNVSYLIYPDNYTFESGGCLFVGLDSGKDDNCVGPQDEKVDWTPEGAGLSNEQIYELVTLEEKKKIMPKIIFMHHPAINEDNDTIGWRDPIEPNGPGGNDACIAKNRDFFIRYCLVSQQISF